MNLDIHNVAKITRSTINTASTYDKRWRTITITTDKGEEIEISLWSKKFDDLLIKEEE